MKFPGSIGVMIIVISFLGCSFISAINITPTTTEEINYEFKSNDIIKNQYKTSEYQNYSIPNGHNENISLDKKNNIFLTSEVTPIKDFIHSLNYSENCESITVKIDLNYEQWDLKTKARNKPHIEYPITPFLCAKDLKGWIKPIDLDKFTINNIITFNYKIGESFIYPIDLNNYALQIDNLYIAHHSNHLSFDDTFKSESLSIKSSDTIQWREKCLSTVMTDPIINIKEINPEIEYYKVNLSNFTKYGDEITINGQSFQIFDKQIMIDSKLYDLCDIDILYNYNTCSLNFNNIDHDLGIINDHKITLKGDWGFIAQYYKPHFTENTEYKWSINPFDIFQINNSYIVTFIGAVIILSGICAYSIGLNFIDWAVIISVITFILIAWKI